MTGESWSIWGSSLASDFWYALYENAKAGNSRREKQANQEPQLQYFRLKLLLPNQELELPY